jgi:NAD-dependent protein deacetylase/lipoamidase
MTRLGDAPAPPGPPSAKALGATTVEINTEPTGGTFDECWAGQATQHVPEFVNRIIDSVSATAVQRT